MLLSIREDLPQPREKLDPGLLCQRGRNVAELNKGTEQCPGLRAEETGLRAGQAASTPRQGHRGHRGVSHTTRLSSSTGSMQEGTGDAESGPSVLYTHPGQQQPRTYKSEAGVT